jgi:hypothetical protein
MLIYGLENGRIYEGENIFGIDFGWLLIAFDLVFFVESKTIKSSQIRGDKLFSYKWILYLDKILFKKLNFYAFLNFGKNRCHILLEGIYRLIFLSL